MPNIIGSGFVVGDGLIATNEHVIRSAREVQRRLDCPKNEWPFTVVLFFPLENHGMCQLVMKVLGAYMIEAFDPGGVYYGPSRPDLGFLHVDMRGLTPVELENDHSEILPGTHIATIGFPMGTDTLMAPGYVHQLCPTLQIGIVSAVLPFIGGMPHAYMLNMMSQGGASGSPIFVPESGRVVGILYGGLEEKDFMRINGVSVPYRVPTNFTYCVPSHFLCRLLENADSETAVLLPATSPHFNDVVAEAKRANLKKERNSDDSPKAISREPTSDSGVADSG